MQKGFWLLLFLLWLGTGFAQDLAMKDRVPGPTVQEDSAVLIRQWFTEAKSLIRTDTLKAERLFMKASASANHNQQYELEAEISMDFARFLLDRSLYNRSFANYLRAKNLYTEQGKERLMAKATMGVAISQFYRGNSRFAIRNFLEVISVAQRLNMPEIESESSEYLGLLYNASQNFNTSTQYFLRALQLKNKTGDNKGVIRNGAKLSEIYYNRRRYDSAYYYANLTYEGAEQLGMKTDLTNALLSKTAALIRLKQEDRALVALKELGALSAGRRGDVNLRLKHFVLSGNFYLSKNNEATAKTFYDSALAIASASTFPEHFAFAYRNISESYSERGEYQTAFLYQQRYVNTLSEMMSTENVRNLGSMEALMDADKSKDEIKLLNAENRLKQLQLLRELEAKNGLERENILMDSILLQERNLSEALKDGREALERESNYKSRQLDNEKRLRAAEAEKLRDEKKLRITLLAGLGLALLMGGVIFYQYNRQRRKNRIIEKQSEDLEVLMKEIHHRVKNNLQVVSSLLNLQSHYIKDAEAVEAVKDSRNRVLSMALIHQSLYQEGDLQAVDVPDYIDKLCNSLFTSYNIRPDKIKLEKNIQPLALNLDTLVPVGLILNELITNSLKYAFPGDRTGVVKISLEEKNETLALRVQDNGTGLPDDFNLQNKASFGFKMINSFLQKLKGTITLYSDKGTIAEVTIKNYKRAYE